MADGPRDKLRRVGAILASDDEPKAQVRAVEAEVASWGRLVPPPPPEPASPEVLLWSAGQSVVAIDPEPYHALGVTGFVVATRWLPGLGGSTPTLIEEREAIYAGLPALRGRTDGRLYLGAYLNNPAAPCPGAEWFDDAAWTQKVLPAWQELSVRAAAEGMDGVAIDQEPYLPVGDPKTRWRWDYRAGVSEPVVRAKVYQRGQQLAEALGPVPLLVYHFDWPGSLIEAVRRATNPDYDASRFVFESWLDGLVGGGAQFRLLDAQMYKAHAPEETWADAVAHQLRSIWPQHRDRWRGFAWVTDGPNALRQRSAGEAVTAWDRAREPAYVAAQLDALRPAGDFAVFDYGGVDAPGTYEPYREALS